MPNFIERNGKILPSYTGVNQPRYNGIDPVVSHEEPFCDSIETLVAEEPEESLWHQPSELVEMPSRSSGRTNNKPLLTVAEAQKGMTDAEIDHQRAINLAGASAARAFLKDKTS